MIDLALIPDSELDNKDSDFIHRTGDTLFAETYVPETYQGKGAYLSGKASRLRDDTGNIVGAIESIHDITERKLAEKALSRSEQQYRELYMKLRDGCAAVDTSGMIVACNNQFLNMTGYTFREIQSLTYQDITPEKWHALEHRILEDQVNVRGYSDPYEKEYVRSDGTVFPVEVPDLFVVPWREGGEPRAWTEVKSLLLAIEVLSPSTARADRDRKRVIYMSEGVPEYWIVDGDAQLIERWRPGDDRPEILHETLRWLTGEAIAEFPTCAAAQLSLSLPQWRKIQKGCAQLSWVLLPKSTTT